jgi:hypothetical protein
VKKGIEVRGVKGGIDDYLYFDLYLVFGVGFVYCIWLMCSIGIDYT